MAGNERSSQSLLGLWLLLGVACQQPSMETAPGPYVIPDPQVMRVLGQPLQISDQAGSVAVVLPQSASSKVQLAARLIGERFNELTGQTDRVLTVEEPGGEEGAPLRIHLLLWQGDEVLQGPLEALDQEDLEVLRDPKETEQSYVIRVEDSEVVLVGSSDQGVLYAAATLVQLLESRDGQVQLAKVQVRDFPDFKYREAADWLQNVESNRWGYDYGDGQENFVRRIKRKLDFCLKYKINAVRFDGLSYESDSIPNYAELMRELNQYARQRGIHLFFWGYGAGYGLGTYQGFFNTPPYQGKVYRNRRSYPDGEIYSCMGMARENERFPPRTLGTCRSNEALNRLKQEEYETFVRAVEPGALYIHHEDLGVYPETQEEWKLRDEECRKRWPNDDLKAIDGGAGGLAHGYNKLLEAVYSVKNEETGYDASRDCIVVLISPVYIVRRIRDPDDYQRAVEEVQREWNDVLQLWVNIFKQLKYQNSRIQGGFREMFPLEGSGEKWSVALAERLRQEDLNFGIYVFVVEGADYYSSDSTFTAAPIGNAIFEGATTLYNFSGTFAQEPLQMLNAEYGWNMRARNFFLEPTQQIETERRFRDYQLNRVEPDEIFSQEGFLGQACRKLYGAEAGKYMYQYFRLSKAQREFAPPGSSRWTLGKIYPMNTMFYNLSNAQQTWVKELGKTSIGKSLAEFAANAGSRPDLTSRELYQKLQRVWTLRGEVAREAVEDVEKALQAEDLKPDNEEDLRHLSRRLQLGSHFSEAVASLYRAFESSEEGEREAVTRTVAEARGRVDEVERFMKENFTYEMTDPGGGDQSSWPFYVDSLREKLDALCR